MQYDFTAFTGHWPFRRLRQGTLKAVLEKYREAGFSGGVISSLEAIFYNDPWEADGPLLEQLRGTGWEVAMCLNPRLPRWEDRMAEARAAGVRFARLYPGIHGYSILDTAPLWELAQKLNITLLITARLEDERLCYLLDQGRVPVEDCAAMARRFPRVQAVLSGFYLAELRGIASWPENLWTDTAGLRHGPLTDHWERMVFGSGFPLNCLESHLLNLPESATQTALETNPRLLFPEGNTSVL